MAERLIHEDDNVRVYEEETPVGVNTRYEYKAGSPPANAATLTQQITTAIQTFENADANWATMTAAQRNDVLKLAVRSLARLGRIINNQLDAT